jgi:glutamyl/glutaminyl-tRNA synthetase
MNASEMKKLAESRWDYKTKRAFGVIMNKIKARANMGDFCIVIDDTDTNKIKRRWWTDETLDMLRGAGYVVHDRYEADSKYKELAKNHRLEIHWSE